MAHLCSEFFSILFFKYVVNKIVRVLQYALSKIEFKPINRCCANNYNKYTFTYQKNPCGKLTEGYWCSEHSHIRHLKHNKYYFFSSTAIQNVSNSIKSEVELIARTMYMHQFNISVSDRFHRDWVDQVLMRYVQWE